MSRLTLRFPHSFMIIIAAALFLATPLFSMAQTPSPDPEDEDMLKFALLPVGDYPEGFFRDVQLQPGSSVELTVAVDNSGNKPVALRTYKANALIGINGGYVSGEMEDEPVGPTQWIDYPTRELTVEPGTQELINFTVTVPPETLPGQYIVGLVVETANPVPIAGTDVLDQIISYAISVGVLVPGDLNYAFGLGEPELEGRYLRVPVENTGSYLVRPAGTMILTDQDGNEVANLEVQMASIYAGYETVLQVILPEQFASGDYTMSLTLSDPESGVSAEIDKATVTLQEPADPRGISVASATIEPNAEEIVFAIVEINLNNGGQALGASNVTLEVLRDGEQVDEFPLATNQVLLNGENTYTTRYIPADMWEPGTYTFRIVVSAVDPNGGQETILLTEDLDAEIVVP